MQLRRPPEPPPTPQMQLALSTLHMCSMINEQIDGTLNPEENPEVLTEDDRVTVEHLLAIAEDAANNADLWLQLYVQVVPKYPVAQAYHRVAKCVRQYLKHCRHVGIRPMPAAGWLAHSKLAGAISPANPVVDEIFHSALHLMHVVAYLLASTHPPLCECSWCFMTSSNMNMPDQHAAATKHFGRYVGEWRRGIK